MRQHYPTCDCENEWDGPYFGIGIKGAYFNHELSPLNRKCQHCGEWYRWSAENDETMKSLQEMNS